MASGTDVQMEEVDGHTVRFYSGVDDLVGPVVDFLGEGLRSDAVCLVVASPDHRRAFETELEVAGFDVGRLAADGSWVTADAAELAEALVVGRRVVPELFDRLVGARVRHAASDGRPLVVYGEIVALLWDAGQPAAAIELEELWNRLRREVRFPLLCSYPIGCLSIDAEVEAFETVCRLHSHAATAGPPDGDIREHRVFPAAADAPGWARRFLTDVLRRAGRAPLCDDAAVVVTELATNAVRHARSRFSVTLSSRGDTVRVAVTDTSSDAPAPRRQGQLDTSGRGLVLVDGLARRWGAAMAGGGKVVWAELQG